jgi:hypothetical protein
MIINLTNILDWDFILFNIDYKIIILFIVISLIIGKKIVEKIIRTVAAGLTVIVTGINTNFGSKLLYKYSKNTSSGSSKTNNKQSSSIYLFLLSYFNLIPVEGQEPVINYMISISSLSLLGLLCLINIIIYLIIYYLLFIRYRDLNFIDQYANKYPRLIKFIRIIINRYKNVTITFIIIEFIFLLAILLMIFISSALLIKQMIQA